MSNKSISIYSEALKRQKAETGKKSPTPVVVMPRTRKTKKSKNTASSTATSTASSMDRSIAVSTESIIVNLEDLNHLRETGYRPRTFRLTEREDKWLKKQAYALDDEIERGEVSKVDLVRIALKFAEILMKKNKSTFIRLLIEMK